MLREPGFRAGAKHSRESAFVARYDTIGQGYSKTGIDMTMNLLHAFKLAVEDTLLKRVDQLRGSLDYRGALSLPQAAGEDIVVAGKEVQLTTFRQVVPSGVLVTVQIARHSMGGVLTFKSEKGLVFA